MPIALNFDDARAQLPASTGGKGANLARLTRAGLPVPEGIILTAEAYDSFVEAAGPILDRVAQFSFDETDMLDRECNELVHALEQLPVPESVTTVIREHLSALGLSAPVSVRSSSTTEDLAGAAFAGQHETYLNCIGVEEVANRVRQCWASLWSSRAVAYRRMAGFDLRATRMAVVIQRMAFCEVAGVGFSLNPVSGDLRQHVFDANYGLGESVVGGEAQIDHFEVDKTTAEVLKSQVATKHFKIVASESGSGTRKVQLAPGEQSQPCLTPDQLRALSQLLNKVEGLYGYPQDIEWGFANGELKLLQSRPITRIPARWTRDESAERFPSAITPLAWALVEEGFHKSLNYSFDLMGMPPFREKWFAMFEHYIYGNQNAVEIYASGAGSSIKIGSLAQLQAAIPVLREQYGWVLELPLTWSRDLDYYLISIGELMREPLEQKSAGEIWAYVLKVKDLGAEYFLPNIAISITQRTLYRILHEMLKMMVGEAKAAATFDDLLAYCETKTGVVNKELHRLAARIAVRPELAARMRALNSQEFLDAGGFALHPELNQSFAKFLRDHGHREVEFDPYHPTWVEAPWLVIENIKAMLDSHREDPAHKERELKIKMSETEATLLSNVPPELRFFVREVIRLARSYTSLDDIEHYQTTRLTVPLRKGLKALGQRLHIMGVVDVPMDVFFANYQMLDAAVRSNDSDSWKAMREAIMVEKTAYETHKHMTPVWQWPRTSNDEQTIGGLTGLPGSPGLAKGQVFKVFGSEDFAHFPKGAVLVARTTNPAWTPLFYKAVAVITESGGPLSHGAVTAREIGLPAVMSVRGVLSTLENGQTVMVDGTAGRVHTLS
jgi:phosphoenolpyruvate synthase/pyruvate phosphate dikinase